MKLKKFDHKIRRDNVSIVDYNKGREIGRLSWGRTEFTRYIAFRLTLDNVVSLEWRHG